MWYNFPYIRDSYIEWTIEGVASGMVLTLDIGILRRAGSDSPTSFFFCKSQHEARENLGFSRRFLIQPGEYFLSESVSVFEIRRDVYYTPTNIPQDVRRKVS